MSAIWTYAIKSGRPLMADLSEGNWLDFWTDELVKGSKWIEVDAPTDQISVFVKADAP